MRMKKKAISLIYDLVLNDDGCVRGDPFFVRNFFSNKPFLTVLKAILVNENDIQYF